MPIDLTLDRVQTLSSKLPPYTRPTCHIAGTNGKGSVAAIITSILIASEPPLTVGRFTSPHLIEPRDCVAIDGQPISSDCFDDAMTLVRKADEQYGTQLTEFELLTLAALSEFERRKVDFVVLEVGLGGRLDATNVVKDENIALSVLTSVDFDHQALLGDTIEEITTEKCGIARRAKPFLLGPQRHRAAWNTACKSSCNAGAFLVTTLPASRREWDDAVDGSPPHPSSFMNEYFSPTPISLFLPCFSDDVSTLLPLHGEHQLDNVTIAAAAVSVLVDHHLCTHLGLRRYIQPSSVERGIRNVKWPGRLSFHQLPNLNNSPIPNGPLNVLVDGAHNPSSATVLSSFISNFIQTALSPPQPEIKPKINLVYILALSHSPPKTPLLTLDPLLPPRMEQGLLPYVSCKVAIVGFTPPSGMSWVKPTPVLDIKQVVEELLPEIGKDVWIPDDLLSAEKQLSSALHWAGSQFGSSKGNTLDLVVVAGSLYLVGDFYRVSQAYRGPLSN